MWSFVWLGSAAEQEIDCIGCVKHLERVVQFVEKASLALGFEQCKADSCVFRLIEGGKIAIDLFFMLIFSL